MKRIYLDNNATTPLDPLVYESMFKYFNENFGNSSSTEHPYGWDAEFAIEEARKKVATFINSKPEEIYFTSGATESHNLLFLSLFMRPLIEKKKPHIITTAIEHKSILKPLKQLESWGAELTILPVNSEGIIALTDLENAIKENTQLISIQWANNEIGCIQPMKEITEFVKKKNIPFHTDAVQAIGKLPISLNDLHIDYLTFSGHKFYGPKGVGALYIHNNTNFETLFMGGNQEQQVRPGTTNVPAIVGLGKACEVAQNKLSNDEEKIIELSQKFYSELLILFPDIKLNGPNLTERLPGQLSLIFPFYLSNKLSQFQKYVACSKGSTCTSSDPNQMSHVLEALNLRVDQAQTTLRFCFGRFNTMDDVQFAVEKVKKYLVN